MDRNAGAGLKHNLFFVDCDGEAEGRLRQYAFRANGTGLQGPPCALLVSAERSSVGATTSRENTCLHFDVVNLYQQRQNAVRRSNSHYGFCLYPRGTAGAPNGHLNWRKGAFSARPQAPNCFIRLAADDHEHRYVQNENC